MDDTRGIIMWGLTIRDCVTTGCLVDMFCRLWGGDVKWVNQYDGGPHEANFLKLDCSRIKSVFGMASQIWGGGSC